MNQAGFMAIHGKQDQYVIRNFGKRNDGGEKWQKVLKIR